MNFKGRAAIHQEGFFHDDLRVDMNALTGRAQSHWLNMESAKDGKIFYDDYGIFDCVKALRKGKKNTPEWFRDTLRSQHILFNIFVPFIKEKTLAVSVISDLLSRDINCVTGIEVEYPSNSENPLGDRTSFDAFVEVETKNGKGFFGIEIKYTEKGYSIGDGERRRLLEAGNIYRSTTEECGLYEIYCENLRTNEFRQIWRNHLLAFKWKERKEYDFFNSVTIYPSGNTHFTKAFARYSDFLTDEGKRTISSITYERLIDTLSKNADSERQRNWIAYLTNRYIVT